jgi:hypothetical protein
MRERERIDRQLREPLIGVCVWLVVEDMDGAVPDLKEVDVAGDRALAAGELWGERNPPPRFDRRDVPLAQAYWNFDGDGAGGGLNEKPRL